MRIGLGVMWCFALGACGGQDGLNPVDSKFVEGAPSGEQTPAVVTQGMPDPIVSIEVGHHQIIRFYDYTDEVLITEEGEAGQDPILLPAKRSTNPKNAPGHFAELFAALRPDLPIPEALVALDDRAAMAKQGEAPAPLPKPNPGTDGARGEKAPLPPGVTAQSFNGPGVQPQSPQGCNNGCCDPDWTPSLCYGRTYTGWSDDDNWNWYQFNYNWSVTTSGGAIESTWANVCSAIGTSTWWFSKHSGSISVAQAHYVSTSWGCVSWFSCSSAASSEVNSSSDPHLHLHCGVYSY